MIPYTAQEQLLLHDRVHLQSDLQFQVLATECMLSFVQEIYGYFVAVLLQCMLGIPHVFCWTWLQSLTAGKTTLMCLIPLRGFRKLFMDHKTKKVKKGSGGQDGVWTQYDVCVRVSASVCVYCKCVDVGASVIDHFHSDLSHLSGLSGQKVRHREVNTVNSAHTTLTCHSLFFFCKENCGGWHQSQKYTAEIKMSAVCPIKITGPLTPVMKRNKGDSKVNTIFSLSPEKKPTRRFGLFAAHRLRSAVKKDLQQYYGLKIFFFPSWQ